MWAQGTTNPVPSLSSASPSQALAGATVPITLKGTGFVSSTVVLVNGVTVPTTFQSATSVVAQIPAAAGSSRSLAVQAQNPAPGGGTGAAFQLAIATLQLTAADPVDGTNSSVAQLGIPVAFSTTNTDTGHAAISWTLQGAGSITWSGTNNVNATYTPPQTMPANPTVTVTAYLYSLPALTTSYTFTLINPTLSVASAKPTQLLTGGTQTVTLTGSGFVPGTTVVLNGTALPLTYVSYTQATVPVPVAANATGTLTLQAQNPAPGGGTPASYSLPIAANSIVVAPTTQIGTGIVLGSSLKMGATVSGSMLTAVTWSVSGGGTISTSGSYVAPITMPTGSVVITAALTSNPSITASYPLTFANSVPVLNSASPSQALAGSTVPITLSGTGFVSSTVILVNGVAVPTTFQSATSVLAQIPAAAGSSGNLAVQAQNPAPGGGTGAAFQLAIATLQLTAADPVDGTNSSVAQLGIPVAFSTTNTDTGHAAISWTLQGAGSITWSGTNNVNATYTPPQTMPANPTVTVTAYLYSLPALTTSYTFTLINPTLSVASSQPTQLLTGGTQTVTLTGSGFVPGTTVVLNGTALPLTYVSYTQATVPVPVAANATGTLTLQAQNPAPAGGSPTSYSLPIAANSIVLAPTTQTGPVIALGASLNMGATVSGSMLTAVTWSVSGGGTISTSGTYVAPTTMPTGGVVITAALTSNPSITASYPLTLANSVPVLNSASPSQALAGATVPITLNGTGFVSSTVVLVNGVAVPTTFQSATSVVAQIPAAAGSSGSLAVQAQNPAPGGGTGAAFQLAIATLQLTAADPVDGTNSSVAQLGIPVAFSTTNTDTGYAAISWTLQGAGSITWSGTNNVNATYTPPQTMPANPTVTVTAYLYSLPALTTSYTFTLINPTLSVASAKPTQLLTGGTQTVTLTGSGFVPGTTVVLNGTALPLTYVSYTQATVPVPVTANATGTLTLQVQNPAPGGGTPASYSLPIAANSIVVAPTTQIGTGIVLGASLNMGATVSGSMLTAVTWSVSGGGTISTSGTYVAPTTMPTGSVVVTAALTSNPSITGSYPLTFVDPVPSLTSANPTQAVSGATVPITLKGTGFVSSTVILVNGVAVSTTFQSATSVVAQIPAAAGSSGSLAVQAQNPAPGGGTGAAFQLAIATLQLTATDPVDGTNSSVAQLGIPVTISATNTDTAHTTVSWTLQGAGKIGTSGTTATYTPPQTMPTNPTVTVTVYLSSLPALTTSYTFNLIYPAPTVTSAKPTQLLTGGTQTVTLTGSGFVPGTTVVLNGTALPLTYVSYTQATVPVPVTANATGTLTLQAQNPAPGGGTPASYSLPIAANSIVVAPTTQIGTGIVLGSSLKMGATVSGSMLTAVTWSVSGGGTISTSGSYVAPITMPTGSVVITAALTSNPSITASYPLTFANSVPVLNSASPSQALAGSTVPITLSGTGFVSSTVILVNGVAVPTTFQSATSVLAQIPAAAGSSGNLAVQAQNPAPGGGTGAAFQLAIATLQLTAADPVDGTNSSVAQLGIPVAFSTTNTDTGHAAISWTLQGAGSITWSGTNNVNATYTPPQTMPANPTVTVTAYLYSLPALTTSYTFTLVNPIPVVTSTTPTQLLTGGSQTVTLTGSGFVPGTTVLFNGSALPIAYLSPTQAAVQVVVAANATGSLTLQPQNPAPGGGLGAQFIENIQSTSITLTATGADGINTGYADIDFNVAMSAVVSGSMQTGINWSVVGPGSISSNGVYTPPSTIPANTAVKISATLASNSAITASYSLTLSNPLPVIANASPLMLPAGATTSLTLSGTGFVPQTVILVNGQAVTTTYTSPTAVVASIPVAASATGNLMLQAQNPSPGGGMSEEFEQAISAPISATSAARLLDQTTFGPTTSLIQHVQQEGVTAWLTEQYNTPQTVLPVIPQPYPSYCVDSENCMESEWWQTVITGNDQLRQRVAFALSQLFVVASSATESGSAVLPYMNTLASDAFTNWYQIMNDVTLSPAMGIYLDMLNSPKPMGTLIADENYAREDMQLFNLGLDLINQDGTPQLDANGNPIPAYSEAQVEAFARAFTGWTYANADGSTPSGLTTISNYNHPLVAVESMHDENPKTLLSGATLPAGQTAEQDMSGALTNVFQHPNLPPFVSRQLIQHLVKSMPSPAYISRVASVFINDGNGVRGDMQAVLTAIFTDPEARAGDIAPQASDGHLREPILWLTNVMRGLNYINVDPNDYWQTLSNRVAPLAEPPFRSPAVFNFFPPTYVIPGTTLNAPEFGIENSASVTDRLTLADNIVSNNVHGFNVDLSSTSTLGQILANQGTTGLVQALNNLFLYGTMDNNTSQAIVQELNTVSGVPAQQIRLAVYLVTTSSEYKILH